MSKDNQFEILLLVLKRFQEKGILKELMLIGSWCLEFYRYHFEDPEKLPAFRTLDVDFLIPHASKIKTETDVPEILKKEGFVATYNRSSDIVKYNHKELQVEFLVPELGRGGHGSREIKNLHIKAVALRYLSMLLDRPLLIHYKGLQVRVPEPAVFALHKLIVSEQRKNEKKKKSDLETALGLLDYLYSKPHEVNRIKTVLRGLPKSWINTIDSIARRQHPKLAETVERLG